MSLSIPAIITVRGRVEGCSAWKRGKSPGGLPIEESIRGIAGLPYYVIFDVKDDIAKNRREYRSRNTGRYSGVLAEVIWEHRILLTVSFPSNKGRERSEVYPGWVEDGELLARVASVARKHTRAGVRIVPGSGNVVRFRCGRSIEARAEVYDGHH
jgi:hypothetical protein